MRTQSPTQFGELNVLLDELTARANDILGSNFIGAYLQGSFAVGDADMQSDCDFLVPVEGPITAQQEAGLRALHRELPTRPEHWARHLEGSYPNKDELRTVDALGKPWLYVDHGARDMEWSTHCNTEMVRWTLRQCGVTLAGPAPETLVDVISSELLRARMRHEAEDFMPRLLEWISLDIAWAQRYAVATLCRILHTLECGRVTSKKGALLWARGMLDPHWSGLVEQALDDRPLGWDPNASAHPGSVTLTMAFADYARERARSL